MTKVIVPHCVVIVPPSPIWLSSLFLLVILSVSLPDKGKVQPKPALKIHTVVRYMIQHFFDYP